MTQPTRGAAFDLVTVLEVRFHGSIPSAGIPEQQIVLRIRSSANGAGLAEDAEEGARSGRWRRLFEGTEVSALLQKDAKAPDHAIARGVAFIARQRTSVGVGLRLGEGGLVAVPRARSEVRMGFRLGPVKVEERWRAGARPETFITLYTRTVRIDREWLMAAGVVPARIDDVTLVWAVRLTHAASPRAVAAGAPAAPPRPFRPTLLVVGILLMLGVQAARANGWPLPLVESYSVAALVAFCVAGAGAARAAWAWRNRTASAGLALATLGGAAVQTGWEPPLVGSGAGLIGVGFLVMVAGLVPGLLGYPFLVGGGLVLAVQLLQTLAGNFALIPAGNWALAVVLMAVGAGLTRRQRRLGERGGALLR